MYHRSVVGEYRECSVCALLCSECSVIFGFREVLDEESERRVIVRDMDDDDSDSKQGHSQRKREGVGKEIRTCASSSTIANVRRAVSCTSSLTTNVSPTSHAPSPSSVSIRLQK